ncbi:VOC family protein [Vagococcus elongatus]|uniref:Glyoxalase n=1 Tax=Vagococcus elongatus TaxID=180344 RepID=A0A430AQZ3_9ENTE|nr:VOC family protein [Vagococcus elongatus]RSU10548.1 glyoxalase [Vagococcus elongatus]
MIIEHIGLWVKDLEGMKQFYETYFDATAGQKYHNKTTNFTSYFLSFETGSRLELMHKPELKEHQADSFGYAHLAIKLKDEKAVDSLVKTLVADRFELVNGPRTTGDGYYEAVIKDPEENLIEITC